MESYVGRSFDIDVFTEIRKKRIVFLVSMLVGILFCAGIFFFLYHWYINREYEQYQVTDTFEVKNANSLTFESYGNGVLRYGRDGITAVDSSGKAIWSGSYDMANPQIDICEESVVVADVGEKSLYIYKGEETGVDFQVDYPIVQACVARQGVIAVVMEDASSNLIGIYNPFNKTEVLLVEIPTNVEDGYPVSIDFSPDGSSLVASYLCVTTGTIQTRVTFYNFSNVGKNSNCLVGAQNYNDKMVSEVRYLDENTVCLFAEDGFYLWNNMKQPVSKKKCLFSEEIQSAFYDASHVGVLLKRDDDKCTMKLFDVSGKNVLTKEISAEYTEVQIRGDEILLHSNTKGAIYRMNGVKKYAGEWKKPISYFFPTSKRNRYLLIQDSKIKKIRLK